MPRTGAMPRVASVSAQDLRSHAVERKRDKESKTKWSPAWAVSGAPVIKEGPNDTKRPRKLSSDKSAQRAHLDNAKIVHKTRQRRKLPTLSEDSAGSDSSAEDSVPDHIELHESGEDHESLQPCDIRGDVVLEMALDKAVAQYEDRQTTKLIDDEYEVLAPESPEDHFEEDDEYELI